MKRKLLLLALSIFILQSASYGQPVPNGGFETWNSINYNDPVGWFNGNLRNLSRMGVAPITKVTGQSGFAVRIQTYIAGGDTSDSYISNTPDDPVNGHGGIPFSQQPTAITGYYRYNLPANDTAGILVAFKKNGVLISMDFFMIRGTGTQST